MVAAVAVVLYRTTLRERELVILSTNDMHAYIDNFPRLATAVAECRDTVSCLLVDAGDRWTGNSYIDLAEGRLPIIDLMNALGYDVAAFGNHEFDKGPTMLQGAIDHATFETICANIKSDTAALRQPRASVVKRSKNGIEVGFVAVVTNYDNGHPDGDTRRYERLTFSNPTESATAAAAEIEGADVKVLLSHLAHAKDMEYAEQGNLPFDLIIGGHSHTVADTLVCGTVIGQTGRRLANVGATRIRMRGNKVVEISYENIPLSNYAEEASVAKMVEKIKQNPYLNEAVGSIANPTTRVGFANLETEVLKRATGADLAFYHYGGIRIANREAGVVSRATLYDLEPFESKIVLREMTLSQLQALIKEKYNDTGNTKESHRIDLYCSEPYDIYTDAAGEAVKVTFPTLRAGRKYRVAMPDYVSKKYPTLESGVAVDSDLLVLDCLIEYVERHSPVTTDNRVRQRIIPSR